MVKKIIAAVGLVIISLFIVRPVEAEIRVYDANKKYVGILLNRSTDGATVMNVYIPPFGIASLSKDMSGKGTLWYAFPLSIVYESNNCSGTGYISASTMDMPLFPSVSQLGGKYFVLDTKNQSKSFVPASTWIAGIGAGSCSVSTATNPQNYVPLLEIPKESLPFPFTFPLHFEYSSIDVNAAIVDAVKAERDRWDANGDNKIGIEEAIRALQIASDTRLP
jgi:hypothetical protein